MPAIYNLHQFDLADKWDTHQSWKLKKKTLKISIVWFVFVKDQNRTISYTKKKKTKSIHEMFSEYQNQILFNEIIVTPFYKFYLVVYHL